MIADILFDLPLRRPLSYAVPPHLKLAPGQRVSAPLQGRPRIGIVAALHAGEPEGLAVVQAAVEAAPVLSTAMLDLGLWAAAESLSAPGSTLAALSPPPPRRGAAEAAAPPPEPAPAPGEAPVLWTDADRDARLAEEAARAPGPVLVVAPDIESAARWAERLGGARLDSGTAEPARRAAWLGAMRGRPRVVVGTRSALLLPLPAPVTLALLDEHDAAHKPPGAPRLHSRELLMERARREGSRLLLLAGAPAVETWHRADQRMIQRAGAESSDAWPELIAADTRGILRNHPLTLPLTRALEDAARRGTRVGLVLSREAAALGCDECGEVIRCPDCGVALGLSRVTASLACRLCGQTGPLAGACPRCGGHRLSPFGWSPERVMTTLRKRFPRLTAARAGGRADKAGRSGSAQVLVGGAGLLRGLAPGSLSAVGFIALDGLLRVPDFRSGERAFQALWAAAEAVGPTGRVIVQTLHPEYYAIEAARTRRRAAFYEPELRFRAELGYPPFRRLCLIDVRGRSLEDARVLLDECAGTLRGIAGLTVYTPTPRGTGLGRRPWWRLLIKGPDTLPGLLDEPLRPLLERRRRSAGMIEIEMIRFRYDARGDIHGMAVLKIRRYGDPILRHKAQPVEKVTAELRSTIADMVETMYHQIGIGLAAPQVGIPVRLILVDDGSRGPRALVNPTIVDRGGSIRGEEGCLSIPGIFGEVERSEWVRVEAQDAEGGPLAFESRGLQARVIQHELDHLDGVLFIDRLPPVTRDRIKKKIQKEGLPAEAPHHAFAL